jgi:3-methyladenine DNA glycosylase/8-oxoguanine DNA glycosylase
MPRRPKSIILAGAHEAVDPWSDGVDHLRQLDPKWAAIIEAVGPCRLTGNFANWRVSRTVPNL